MKTKLLTKKDLNDFKLNIIKYNDILARKSQKMIDAKAKYSRRQVEKNEVEVTINEYKESKKIFNEISDIKPFIDNLKNTKKQSSSKEEIEDAKLFLKEAKLAVKERGKSGELKKLTNTALKLSNISFRYRPDYPLVVNNVSVEINHGEYVAIIGHNGSGKSTLSKIIIGVLQPNDGKMEVFGNLVRVNNLPLIRRFLGIVFQNPDNQFIGSTVRDDIAFGLENRRISPSLMSDIILDAAKKVKMEEFLDHEPLMLSGGQKQRVAIASALALSPEIIIFDEATSMLDPKGKTQIKNIMVDLKNTREKTILSITHDMDEILNADKVLIMNKGEMVKFGTPQEILSDKEFLRSIHLDIPFVAQMEEALANVGIKVSPSSNIDELVVKLCKK